MKSGAWEESGVFVYTTSNHIKYALTNGYVDREPEKQLGGVVCQNLVLCLLFSLHQRSSFITVML